jgi:uncharacterized protein
MIAIDTNLLIFAHRPDAFDHRRAVAALRPVIEGDNSWAIPWPCVHEFISVSTNPRIYRPASTVEQSLEFLELTFGSPHLQILAEGPGYFRHLTALAKAANIIGPRIHDARVAALCLHHGVRELWTADRDFSLFPQLKTRNPLVAAGAD